MSPDMERLKELASKATPGEWKAVTGEPNAIGATIAIVCEHIVVTSWQGYDLHGDCEADAAYIAAANPATVLSLLSRMAALEGALDLIANEQREDAAAWMRSVARAALKGGA